MELTIVI